MRIHTDTLTYSDMTHAAMAARVNFTTIQQHGSRSRDHSFDVILTGESRRRQNGGEDMAATWDQWGVFLAYLFDKDSEAKCWAYSDASQFAYRTVYRFEDGWPTDAHGDHRFQYDGMPYTQKCTKCTARNRWQ